jgi:H+/Cl- antiporter ClcA
MVGASFHNIACGSFAALQIPESILSSSGLVFDLAGVPAYSMVGAASVLAAIFRAPLTASLLLFEITRNYDVLLPLLASAGVASLVSDILESKIEQAK